MEKLSGYKYKLRPTKKQVRILSRWVGACRFIYNAGLEHRQLCYNQYQKSISYYEQQNGLPEIKKCEGFEWLKEVPSQSLQFALRNLETAYKIFFRGTGSFPQPKKKGKCTDSITFPQGNNIEILELTQNNSKVEIPKIGAIKFRDHRDIEGEIKSATISRQGSDWLISFCVKSEIEVNQKPLELFPIGLDKGIIHTIAASTKDFFDLPVQTIKELEQKISSFLQKRAKEEKFSSRWHHFNKIIGKLHKKITRLRLDFLHKLSFNLTQNHSLIVVEKLKVKNMSASASGTIDNPGKMVAQKSGLNRSILRQGWGMFQNMLDYKAKWYGSYVEKVNPMYTSQTCSECNIIDKNSRKSQSLFSCSCGHEENADTNAAKNILRLGLESLGCFPQEAPTTTAQAV